MNKLLNTKNINIRKQVLQNISKNNTITNNVLDISYNMLLKKYNLSLIAIFKNESHILKEWIEHYINEGVDKFYLIDNGSTDNYIHLNHIL